MRSRLTYGREPVVFQNHAQIVIGGDIPKLMNWSCGTESFDLKDADHTTARTIQVRPFVNCSPQLHDAKQLPLFRSPSMQQQFVFRRVRPGAYGSRSVPLIRLEKFLDILRWNRLAEMIALHFIAIIVA